VFGGRVPTWERACQLDGLKVEDLASGTCNIWIKRMTGVELDSDWIKDNITCTKCGA
jgi:hypothetical protein